MHALSPPVTHMHECNPGPLDEGVWNTTSLVSPFDLVTVEPPIVAAYWPHTCVIERWLFNKGADIGHYMSQDLSRWL